MSEPLPESVSPTDFRELQQAVKDLADALKAREDADTVAETKAAQEDVTDARADLDALAKELGVSPAKLREAADKAKRDEEKERIRPLLVELLDEELATEPEPETPAEPAEPAEEKPADEEAAPDEEQDVAPDPEPEPEDSAPEQAHWSERSIGELLGR